MTDPWSVIEAALRDAGAGWSLGSFGAVAEFHQDPGEPAQVEALTRCLSVDGFCPNLVTHQIVHVDRG